MDAIFPKGGPVFESRLACVLAVVLHSRYGCFKTALFLLEEKEGTQVATTTSTTQFKRSHNQRCSNPTYASPVKDPLVTSPDSRRCTKENFLYLVPEATTMVENKPVVQTPLATSINLDTPKSQKS